MLSPKCSMTTASLLNNSIPFVPIPSLDIQLILGCQTQSESGFHFVGFFVVVFFFRVGKSLACHSPAKWCLSVCIESSVSILLGLRGLG